MRNGRSVQLLYRVDATAQPSVIAGLRAQGFSAASDDRVVGRGRAAIVVSDLAAEDEAAEVADAMMLLDQTAELLTTD